MIERLLSGAPGLDKLLRGGFPKGSLGLVIGPPGAGKTILGLQFLLEGLLSSRACILVDTVDLLPTLMEVATAFGWDRNLLNKIDLFDCFSWRTGSKSAFPYSASPSNPSDLSIGLGKLIEDSHISNSSNARLVFDSLSDIILQTQEFAKFLPILRAKLSKAGITALLMIEAGIHDERSVAAIEHESDGTIMLKAEEAGRFVMVKRMIHTPTELKWIPFNISQGIEIMADIFFR